VISTDTTGEQLNVVEERSDLMDQLCCCYLVSCWLKDLNRHLSLVFVSLGSSTGFLKRGPWGSRNGSLGDTSRGLH